MMYAVMYKNSNYTRRYGVYKTLDDAERAAVDADAYWRDEGVATNVWIEVVE